MKRADLPNALQIVLQELGGKARMMDVFRLFWSKYGNSLTEKDDLFYTWNYDLRWAATQLRKKKRMKPAKERENTGGAHCSPKGIWELV